MVVALIAAFPVAAAEVSIRDLNDPDPVDHLAAVGAAAVVGFVGNEWVARYRIRVGRRIGSAALVADGLHARTDGFASLAVLLGAVGVAAGVPAADPIIGLMIAVVICVVLRQAAREIYRRLMDAVDRTLLDRARATRGGGDHGGRRGHFDGGAPDLRRRRARTAPRRSTSRRRHRPP